MYIHYEEVCYVFQSTYGEMRGYRVFQLNYTIYMHYVCVQISYKHI